MMKTNYIVTQAFILLLGFTLEYYLFTLFPEEMRYVLKNSFWNMVACACHVCWTCLLLWVGI